MADKISVKLQGMNAALNTLKELPKEVAQSNKAGPVRLALSAAARKMRDALKAAAPVKSGALRDSITARRSPTGYGAGEMYVVGPKGKKMKYANSRANRAKGRAGKSYEAEGSTFYGRFLEYGTKPYKGNNANVKKRRRAVAARGGIEARHWMKQAGSGVAGVVIETGRDELVGRVEKLAAKINGAGGKD